VIGPSLSGTSLAVVPLAEKYKTPLVSCAASYKIVHNDKTGKPYKWVFKTPQTDTMAVEAIYTRLQKSGINKIAIISVTSGFGASGRGELMRLAPKYKMNIVADEKYGPKDTDMTAQLTRINAKGVDGIIAWTVGPAMGIIAKNVKQLGIKAPLFECHGSGDPIFWKVAGEAGEGVMMPSTKIVVGDQLPDSDVQKKKIIDYVKAYQKKFNREPGTMVAYGADAAFIVINAIKQVGPDRAKIRDAIENTKGYVGLSGIYNISAKDHNGLSMDDIVMIKATKGGWKLLE
jgi:branched-chain amino acid transport system substrate-binding protein